MKISESILDLTDTERMLIQQYHDNEGGVIKRWQAERLLNRKEAARLYRTHLQDIAEQVTDFQQEQVRDWNTSLWDRVERRLDEEERAAVLLGKRTIITPRSAEEENAWFPWAGRLAWSASGACFASIVMFALISKPAGSSLPVPGQATQISSDQQAPATIPYRTVKFAPETAKRPGPVEIDWLHSDGTVRLIQSKERRVPTIWVTRKRVRRTNPRVQAPAGSSVPTVINVNQDR